MCYQVPHLRTCSCIISGTLIFALACKPVCAHVHTHTHTCARAHTHAHTHTRTHTHTHAHTHTHKRTHVHKCARTQNARQQGVKLVAEQVHAKLRAEGWIGDAGDQVALSSTHKLLEQLRFERMVVGSKNMKADLQQGHPDYPYLYQALPFQVRTMIAA